MAQAIIAPDINWPDMKWVNYDRALSLGELRGKVIVLYFWTAGSVQCHHLFPALRHMEDNHSEELAIIGIHTPKFSAERSIDTVRHAVARYGLRHPVVHDPDRLIWRLYAVKSWPTLVFIGADGRLLGQVANEPDTDSLLTAVSQIVQKAYKSGQMRLTPMPRANFIQPDQRFYYPSHIKRIRLPILEGDDEPANAPQAPAPGGAPTGGPRPDAARREPEDEGPVERDYWIVSDTGHNQIVLLNNTGKELRRFGAIDAGFKDGDADAAQFRMPSGVYPYRRSIYIADTGNHAIRRLDLENDIVTTVAGNGKRGGYLGAPIQASAASLASPYDVVVASGQLYFCNTGTHQLGRYDFQSNSISVLAGNGAEAIVDGPPLNASFARPMALTPSADGSRLYVCDAETSSIRSVLLTGDFRISTLIGNGPYDFGKIDGPFLRARLQQPLGVCMHRGMLVVADSYNNILRELDLGQQMTREFIGMEYKNVDHRPLPLSEPIGVASIDDQKFLCVDRNNHRIVVFEPRMKVVKTWAS